MDIDRVRTIVERTGQERNGRDFRRPQYAMYIATGLRVQFNDGGRENPFWRLADSLGWSLTPEYYRIHPDDDHLVPEEVVFPWETPPVPEPPAPVLCSPKPGQFGRVTKARANEWVGAIVIAFGSIRGYDGAPYCVVIGVGTSKKEVGDFAEKGLVSEIELLDVTIEA